MYCNITPVLIPTDPRHRTPDPLCIPLRPSSGDPPKRTKRTCVRIDPKPWDPKEYLAPPHSRIPHLFCLPSQPVMPASSAREDARGRRPSFRAFATGLPKLIVAVAKPPPPPRTGSTATPIPLRQRSPPQACPGRPSEDPVMPSPTHSHSDGSSSMYRWRIISLCGGCK